MNHADRLALLAFLRARLRDGGDERAAAALRAVIELAETAFTDDEEWSLVPDPVAQTVPFVRADFAEKALLRAAAAWDGHPAYPADWSAG